VSTLPATRRSPLARAAAWLPQGRTLPLGTWGRRHLGMLALLWLHVPALAAFGLTDGVPLAHLAPELLGVAALAGAASLLRTRRRTSATLVAVGLLTCSALAVHLAHGAIEAHFHFFVVVAVLVLYEDWVPYGAALAYVLLHHGIAGAVSPASVFAHDAGVEHPWRWAAIHAGFIGAVSVAGVIGWRSNEAARREVAERSDLLASVVRSSGDAMFTLTRRGIIRTWNAAAERLLGWSAEEVVGRPVAAIIPAHRAGEAELVTRRVIDGEAPLQDFETERLHRDGSLVEVALSVSPVRDATGRIVGRSAVARDISARRRAEAALRAERERFAGAFDFAPTGMLLAALDGTILRANAALTAMHGDADLTGRDVRELVHPDDFAAGRPAMRAVLRGEATGATLEQRHRRADGTTLWVRVQVALALDADGRAVHQIAHVEDVTARKEHEAAMTAYADELKARSSEDPLTGLGSRRELEAELARRTADPAGAPFALTLLTLAGLRRVNDERGYATGDRLLRETASALGALLPAGGRAYRFGGATLAVLLPGAGVEEGRAVADALHERVAALDPLVRVVPGPAAWPADGPRPDLLVLRAEVESQAARSAAAPAAHDAAGRAAHAQPALPPTIAALLETAREHLGLDVAWLSQHADDDLVFRALAGDAASFGLAPQATVATAAVPCGGVLDGTLPNAIGDVRAHPVAGALPAVDAAGLGAYVGVPVELSDGRSFGMLCAAGHAARPGLGEGEARLMRALAALVARQLEDDGRQAARRRAQAEGAGLSALLAALEARDHYTGEHSEAVVQLAGEVAGALGLDDETRGEVEQVALLHDIGKVGIPDSVLQKRGPLDDLEWELMRQHSVLGARIVASIGSLAHLAPAVRAEHERYDGTGYPDGLAGEEIPLASRIVLATDAFHAMTSDRPYRARLPLEDALRELDAHAGAQFDPVVVAALVRIVGAPAGA
jgi:PAS domain S-box-containing protein